MLRKSVIRVLASVTLLFFSFILVPIIWNVHNLTRSHISLEQEQRFLVPHRESSQVDPCKHGISGGEHTKNGGGISNIKIQEEEFPYPYARSQHYGDLNHKHDNIHLSHVCGDWQQDYIDLHKQILDENKKDGYENFLIFSSCGNGIDCGGFGDHMAGLITSFTLALLFRRALLIDWNEVAATEAIIPSTIDWRMNSNLRLSKNSKGPVDLCNVNLSKEDLPFVEMNFLNLPFEDRGKPHFECMEKLKTVGTIMIHANNGISHLAVVGNDTYGELLRKMGFSVPYISSCILRFLIRPHPKIVQKVSPQLQKLTDPTKLSICIHSRYIGDDSEFGLGPGNMTAQIEATEQLFTCAADLTTFWGGGMVGTTWFFMSSVKELKKIFYEKYKDFVIVTGVQPKHTNIATDRAQALETTVMEWYLFSACNLFVFHESGLSKTAAMYSMRPMSAFMFDREQPDISDCDPSQPTSIFDMAASWSGL